MNWVYLFRSSTMSRYQLINFRTPVDSKWLFSNLSEIILFSALTQTNLLPLLYVFVQIFRILRAMKKEYETKKEFSTIYDVKEELGRGTVELFYTIFFWQYRLPKNLNRNQIKGAFSIVKRAVNKTTGLNFAVKVIATIKLTKRDLDKVEREVRICQKLRHENIVRLHETYADDLK